MGTVIKQNADDGTICRNQSEIALRKLLRVLQEQYQPGVEEDAKSVGSSGASVLGNDICTSIISDQARAMNQTTQGTDPKPKFGVTRSIQAMPQTVDDQANQLLNQILTELDIPTTESVSESTPTKRTSTNNFENESDAATQISKVLVQRLVPH